MDHDACACARPGRGGGTERSYRVYGAWLQRTPACDANGWPLPLPTTCSAAACLLTCLSPAEGVSKVPTPGKLQRDVATSLCDSVAYLLLLLQGRPSMYDNAALYSVDPRALVPHILEVGSERRTAHAQLQAAVLITVQLACAPPDRHVQV